MQEEVTAQDIDMETEGHTSQDDGTEHDPATDSDASDEDVDFNHELGEEESTASTTNTGDDSGEEDSEELVDIMSLPFTKNIQLFSSLPEEKRQEILATLSSDFKDVDKWEISMTPDDYKAHFNTQLACLQLSAHAPKKGVEYEGADQDDDSDDDEGVSFPKFFLLARACHQLWVSVNHKDAFFKELKKWRTVQPSIFEYVSSSGAAHVPVIILTRCLNAIECRHIIVREFGQKLPFIEETLATEPSPPHPASASNCWDIGVTWKCDDIFLFAPVIANDKKISRYPMVIPGSLDYGSVCVFIRWQRQQYKVKIYPRLVHVIKSINSRFQGEPLKTIAATRKKMRVAEKMVHSFSQISGSEIGGFRIEVSITNATLTGAKEVADGLPFYDIQWWLSPPAAYESYKLDVKVLNKQTLINNAKWVHQRADDLSIMTGNNSAGATALQKQVAADVSAALGWNAGKGHITKSLSSAAWWRGVDSPDGIDFTTTTNNVRVLRLITRLYSTRASFKQLVIKIRDELGGFVPCPQSQPDDNSHQLVRNGWNPVRMACTNSSCSQKFHDRAVYRYLAKLVITGVVRPESIGLPAETDPGQEEQEDDDQQDQDEAPMPQEDPTYVEPTKAYLMNIFGNTKDDIKTLIEIVRNSRSDQPGGARLPCLKRPDDFTHQYVIHKWDEGYPPKFRLRCREKTCRHGLGTSDAFEYFASFINCGDVTREAVGMPESEVSHHWQQQH